MDNIYCRYCSALIDLLEDMIESYDGEFFCCEECRNSYEADSQDYFDDFC